MVLDINIPQIILYVKIFLKRYTRCDRISMERLELANITVARDSRTLSPLVLTSAQIFIGGMILLVVSIPVEGLPGFHYPVAYYGVLLWLSMVSAVGFSIWFSLLKKPGVKVSTLNLWKFIIPVFGAVIVWIILPDEQPELAAIIGMVFVVLSILSFNLCNMVSKSCD